MQLLRRAIIAISFGFFAQCAQPTLAQDSVQVESAREEITSATKRFVMAFNTGETATLMALCTKTGGYVDGTHPRVFFQDRIRENAAADASAEQGTSSLSASVVMSINNIRFITPQVAMVDGTSIYRRSPEVVPVYSRYSAVWVHQGNNWLLDDIRENPVPDNSHNAHLRSLDWLMGSWIDNAADPRLAVSYRWSNDGTYIESASKSRLPGRGDHTDTQRIGWDARYGQFRSWSFAQDGGFDEGLWAANEQEGWTIEVSGTTADGFPTGGQIQIKKIDANTMEWAFTNGTKNGQTLPEFRLRLFRRAQ